MEERTHAAKRGDVEFIKVLMSQRLTQSNQRVTVIAFVITVAEATCKKKQNNSIYNREGKKNNVENTE